LWPILVQRVAVDHENVCRCAQGVVGKKPLVQRVAVDHEYVCRCAQGVVGKNLRGVCSTPLGIPKVD